MNTNNNRHLLSTYHAPEAVVAHMIINTIIITVIPQLRQPTYTETAAVTGPRSPIRKTSNLNTGYSIS